VFCTSAAVLVLEILAGRLMAPYVGVSLETFTGIIGTMLAGIALGNALGGRLADRHAPERLIGPAMALGGLSAWASLPIVSAAGPNFGSNPVAIVALALLAFFAPAAILSAISPMVAKLRLTDLGQTGEVVGGLSATGTVGALFGTFVTGFILVSAVPTRPIIIGLGLALVVAGVGFTFRVGRTRPDATLSAVALVVFGIAVTAGSPCQFESAYFCGSVVTDAQDESVRYLILDGRRHAAVDLDDPTNLEFRYISLLGDVVDAAPAGPLVALHIGGGGFTVPRYIEATRPGSDNFVLEIDPVLVDVAVDELGLVTNDRLRVRIGDARLALADLDTDSVDIVVGDAFASTAVPWHLTTEEFITEVHRVLKPDGVYAMNLIDGRESRFARAELATLRRVFNNIDLIIPAGGIPNRAVNQILLASDAALPELEVDPSEGQLIDDVQAFIGNATYLSDDFAPVDWLSLNN